MCKSDLEFCIAPLEANVFLYILVVRPFLATAYGHVAGKAFHAHGRGSYEMLGLILQKPVGSDHRVPVTRLTIRQEWRDKTQGWKERTLYLKSPIGMSLFPEKLLGFME